MIPSNEVVYQLAVHCMRGNRNLGYFDSDAQLCCLFTKRALSTVSPKRYFLMSLLNSRKKKASFVIVFNGRVLSLIGCIGCNGKNAPEGDMNHY
ncbi:hypothetical protein CEXT_795581 [Caerostris extrusa]|uniref:Uncharacterized protein n=1 Tax=Caerostris extrusa TaxID=172846 RepID=A0AAV4MXL9_CAEEX|nr:hypothetical protein CEXT_795581 [Caerostris extrusa]